MMQLTAASIGFLSLLLPAPPAEARPKNATIRQKFMEKFEELRQKAGLSKPKDKGDEKSKLNDDDKDTKPKMKNDDEEKKAQNHKSKLNDDNKETKTKLKNGGEEKKAQNHKEAIPSVPTLPYIINGTTVESTLP